MSASLLVETGNPGISPFSATFTVRVAGPAPGGGGPIHVVPSDFPDPLGTDKVRLVAGPLDAYTRAVTAAVRAGGVTPAQAFNLDARGIEFEAQRRISAPGVAPAAALTPTIGFAVLVVGGLSYATWLFNFPDTAEDAVDWLCRLTRTHLLDAVIPIDES